MGDIPADLRHGPDHMWARTTPASAVVRVGITDHAQEALGDIRNDSAQEAPELINSDPYGHGWLFDVEVDPPALADQLTALVDDAGSRRPVGK